MSTFNTLAQAIAREENTGWTNDPGAIENSAGEPIDFGSPAAGMSALENQLEFDASGNSSIYSPNMSLSDYEKAYTGGDPNAGENVASMLGVPSSTPLSDLSDNSLQGAENTINGILNKNNPNPLGAFSSGIISSAVPSVLKWLLSSQLVIGVIGIICIAVGLLMFKTTGVVIKTAGRAAVKGAEIAA